MIWLIYVSFSFMSSSCLNTRTTSNMSTPKRSSPDAQFYT